MELFRRITGDVNPLHTEQGVVYGLLTASYLSTLAGMYLPGERSLIQQVKLDFLNPLRLRGEKNCEITVLGRVESVDDKFRTLLLKFSIIDDSGIKVARGTMRVGVRE